MWRMESVLCMKTTRMVFMMRISLRASDARGTNPTGESTPEEDGAADLDENNENGASDRNPGRSGGGVANSAVIGCILIQFVILVSMEWNNSGAMEGLNSYEKLVGSLFQVTNTRHTGESVFDLSTISPAVLVVFVIMMYLSPYTSFLPDGVKKGPAVEVDENITFTRTKTTWLEYLRFSEPTYLTIFVVLICISERNNLKEDPLNFNVLNIIIEVISAYGNVGFSMGYSCKRRIKSDGQCKDAYYGFAGRWSPTGKWILIIVMLYGRLKYFHKGGGKAWKLL